MCAVEWSDNLTPPQKNGSKDTTPLVSIRVSQGLDLKTADVRPNSLTSFEISVAQGQPWTERNVFARGQRTYPIERYQTLRDGRALCLSRAATPLEGHQIRARTRRAPGNTFLNQPYRRRVSTDRLNREGSHLAASLEGETGPTPTGKNPPTLIPRN